MIDGVKNILIIGLGLIGGSYAAGLTAKGYTVSAIDTDEKAIRFALEKGYIESGKTDVVPEMLQDMDLVIFGLYPDAFVSWIETYGHLLPVGSIITDVTGVKTDIVYAVQQKLSHRCEFVASHPMAGKEVGGVENADPKILVGANFIVTPTDANTPHGIDQIVQLGKELSFGDISVISPEVHDNMIGFVSQLTHAIAVSLMNSSSDKNLKRYTGDSFRDLTRIARINEKMWSRLFILNKNSLIGHIDSFVDELERLKQAVDTEDMDALEQLFITSTQRRAEFDKN